MQKIDINDRDAALILTPDGEDDELCKVTTMHSPDTPRPVVVMLAVISEIVKNRQDLLVDVLHSMDPSHPDWANHIEGNA
jgi:hypothetical protein